MNDESSLKMSTRDDVIYNSPKGCDVKICLDRWEIILEKSTAQSSFETWIPVRMLLRAILSLKLVLSGERERARMWKDKNVGKANQQRWGGVGSRSDGGTILGHFLPSPCCLSAFIVLLSWQHSTADHYFVLDGTEFCWAQQLPILSTNHEGQF